MMAAHPTSFPDKNKMVSGDYPYHICNKLHKLGERLFFRVRRQQLQAIRAPEASD